MATLEDCAYMAGIIDGEGSILIARTDAKRRLSYVYPTVKIGNTSKTLIDWIEDRWPSSIKRHTRKPQKEGHKELYSLRWTKSAVTSLLEDIKDYLVVKRAQCDAVLDLIYVNSKANEEFGSFGNGHPLPEQLMEYRYLAWRNVRLLNGSVIN